MKYLLFVALALPVLSMGQNKMEGIGQFKINITTIQDIGQFAKGLGIEVKTSNQILDFTSDGTSTGKIMFVISNQEDEFLNSPFAPVLEKEKVLFMDVLNVSGIKMREVYMRFWNDTLYKIETEGSDELSEALKLKYGNPFVEKKEKPIQCRSGAGVQYNEKAVTYTSRWPGTNGIQGIAVLGKNFDSKCKARMFSTFTILDSSKSVKINKLEVQYLAQKKNEDDKVKKTKLKDF